MTDNEYQEKLCLLRKQMESITKDIRYTAKYNTLMVSPQKNPETSEQKFIDLSKELCFIMNPTNEGWLLYQKNRDDYVKQAETLIADMAVLVKNIDWTE